MAYPIRWVKLIFVCPERDRKPLITLRLTSSSLAGTLRKLVAVGTVRLRSMLAAIAAPTPRIGLPGSSSGFPFDSGSAACAAFAAGAALAAGAGAVLADALPGFAAAGAGSAGLAGAAPFADVAVSVPVSVPVSVSVSVWVSRWTSAMACTSGDAAAARATLGACER